MEKAFVLINCEMGHEGDIIRELNDIDQVREAYGTFGAYDVIAEVGADTKESLRETITWKIRKLQRVRSTLTLKSIEGQS